MHPVVEVTLSLLLRNRRADEARYFFRSPAFRDCPAPTIEVTCPDLSEGSGSLAQPATFRKVHSADGPGTMPTLDWTAAAEAFPRRGEVQEWLVVVEDPDAPLRTPIPHG